MPLTQSEKKKAGAHARLSNIVEYWHAFCGLWIFWVFLLADASLEVFLNAGKQLAD